MFIYCFTFKCRTESYIYKIITLAEGHCVQSSRLLSWKTRLDYHTRNIEGLKHSTVFPRQ